VLSRAGKGDRVPGIWVDGRAPAALVVHPDGADAARNSREVRELKAAGRAILLIDAFQTGSAVAPRDRSHRFFLTFNRSDDANRVQDILTALAFLKANKPGEIELVGLDRAAVWSVFAAALSPEKVKLNAVAQSFAGTDQEFLDRFFVPGIQRAGGWKAALALTAAQ
jgi:dienelactone hydrolase